MDKNKFSAIVFGAILFFVSFSVSCSKSEKYETVLGNGIVYGRVVDGNTGEPVQGCSVTLYPGGRSVVTGTNGQYEFRDLIDGGYLLQISKSGYYSNAEAVTLSGSVNVQTDISLVSGNPCLNVMIGELYFSSTTTSKVFVVSNVGDHTIDWNLYTDYNRILSFDQECGTLEPGENVAVSVSMNHTLTNEDLTSFPVYVYSGREELGVIATINKESAGMNNSIIVGNWALANNVFWSELDGEYLYNTYPMNSIIYTFRPDYFVEIAIRSIGTGMDGDDAESVINNDSYISDYTYDPANNLLILSSELEYNKEIFRINKLSKTSMELETINLKDQKKYTKLTFVRL